MILVLCCPCVPWEEILKRIEDTGEKLHMKPLIGRNMFHLSGGEKQRLAIAAVALAHKNVILFDEPTSGLDYVHMKQAADLIRKLAESGKIILTVSHDLDLLLSTCDEVLLIENSSMEKRYPLTEETQGELVSWFQSF